MSFVVSAYELRPFGGETVASFPHNERDAALAGADALMAASTVRSVEISAVGHQSDCKPSSCQCKRQLVWLVTRADYDYRRLNGALPLFPAGTPRRGRPSGLSERLA